MPRPKKPKPPALTPEWAERLRVMAADVGESPDAYLERLVRRAWAGRGGDVSRSQRPRRARSS